MTIAVSREVITNGSPDGAILTGAARQVISGVGATRTLLTKESGALCLFDRAAGVVYTLPLITADNIGMQFDFLATVSVTSNAYKAITGASTQFLVGGVTISSLTVAEAGDFFVANGTTHVSISEDGATKGGLVGGGYRVTAISATVWAVKGVTCGAGTLADPFATS
jgi:hypothetical protein